MVAAGWPVTGGAPAGWDETNGVCSTPALACFPGSSSITAITATTAATAPTPIHKPRLLRAGAVAPADTAATGAFAAGLAGAGTATGAGAGAGKPPTLLSALRNAPAVWNRAFGSFKTDIRIT